ncbi:hypothetical protein EGW08_009036 [Elysia chlorotica]|uniref:Sulfatase N-terminal domain-containing protein n=1 Tax=Elysia chlorotica TaxID=188477 RepID=A0A3S0ZQ94_ELYCH|nr:hypothetical protein EGW08_009036 [Elysia chlorotica]
METPCYLVQATVVVLSLLSLHLALAKTNQTKDDTRPPHIVFIVTDDLGWNDVGWHNPQILTPNLNSLAENGIKLESSYVQPTCTPSRNSFMTGMFPFHTELQRVMDPSKPTYLPLKYPTIAEKLKQRGYSTHMVGKWHLGYCNEKYTPVRRGFDSFLGFYMGSQCHYTHVKAGSLVESVTTSTSVSSFGHDLINSFLRVRTQGLTEGRDFRFNNTVWRKTEGEYSTHAFTDRAIEIIKRQDPDEPLFLYIPFSAPHSPLQVPSKYEQLYSHIKSRERRIYSGMVTALDEAVGKIVDALQDKGMTGNMFLVFTSDNGGSSYMGGNNLPLRGGKNTLWEGGTRVPTFVYSPTLLTTAGSVSDQLFHAVDWFPTFLEAAGAPPAQGIDGLSQWEFLTTGKSSPRTEFVYGIGPEGKGAIRVGDYKLIVGRPGLYNDWYPIPGTDPVKRARFKGGRHDSVKLEKGLNLLFNIKDDPSETTDIAGQFPDLVSELMDKYSAWNRTKVTPHEPERIALADPALHGGFWTPGWC